MIKICLLIAAFIGVICFGIALKNADDNADNHLE
jgi:hypothetical protein